MRGVELVEEKKGEKMAKGRRAKTDEEKGGDGGGDEMVVEMRWSRRC